jgi:hypothetical protein
VPDVDEDGMPEFAVSDPAARATDRLPGIVAIFSSRDGKLMQLLWDEPGIPTSGAFGDFVAGSPPRSSAKYLAVSKGHYKTHVFAWDGETKRFVKQRTIEGQNQFSSLDGFGTGLRVTDAPGKDSPEGTSVLVGCYDIMLWKDLDPDFHPYTIVDALEGQYDIIRSTRLGCAAIPAGVLRIGDGTELIMLAIGDEFAVQRIHIKDKKLAAEFLLR